MNAEQERSRSLWMETAPPSLPRLAGDLEVDVLVIGAGIAGLTTAYELVRAGRQVTVVDRGRFGRGMTARTTAHLAFEPDDFFQELARTHGKDGARQWFGSQSAAVDLIERIAAEEEIACDFARIDGVFMAAEDKDVAYLRKELEAAREAGFAQAEWVGACTLPGVDRDGVRFPRQARFHPLKFLNGVIEALRRSGATLYQDSEITALEERGDVIVATAGEAGVVFARQVVVATNTPFHLTIPIHSKQAPFRTYVIAAPLPAGAAADVLLWDTLKPYHYVRLQPGATEDLLIVGGEDHRTGTVDDGEARIQALETWARSHWPWMGRLTHAWSGQVFEPADHVGFIGRSPDFGEVYVVTGDSGQGLTTGGAAALILTDLMNGRENPWASLYRPNRQMHRGLGETLMGGYEVARHWLELAGPGEIDRLDELAAGDGALVKIGGKSVAAYRDDAGELHLHSAACTHAGCAIHWNGFEDCWDCPCHGSQFSAEGEVLAGPAVKPLKPVPFEADRGRRHAQAERHELLP